MLNINLFWLEERVLTVTCICSLLYCDVMNAIFWVCKAIEKAYKIIQNSRNHKFYGKSHTRTSMKLPILPCAEKLES